MLATLSPSRRSRRRRLPVLPAVLSAIVVTIAAAGCSPPASPLADTAPSVADPAETTATLPALSPTPSSTAADANTEPSAPPATSPSISAIPTASTTAIPTASTTTSPPTTITTLASATTDPVRPGASETLDLSASTTTIGVSFEGRPIVAERFGTPGGRRVLVIGVIHGDEDAGVEIVRDLRGRDVPDGVELWLVESMNPDGQSAQRRHNANGVDLNRNFPHDWGPIGVLGDSQYAGPAAASEPETQTMVSFIAALRPDIAIWYHQDANLVIPSTGRDGRLRARYAELTGLPIAQCCGGGVYTGVAATWARVELKRDSDAVPFIVELPGGDLDSTQIDQHAGAVLTLAAEG